MADGTFLESSGGSILNRGTVTLTNSTVSGSSAGQGGGIYNYFGSLAFNNSTVSGNSASQQGGGIFNFGASVTLVNSTVSGNSAGQGGGIFNRSDTVALTNSTVAGNSAAIGGGGVYNIGDAILTNTIIANQLAGADCIALPAVVSNDHNLDSDGSCNLTQANDIPGGNANLGPLALNAPGATATHALLSGSDALEAGDCSGGHDLHRPARRQSAAGWRRHRAGCLRYRVL